MILRQQRMGPVVAADSISVHSPYGDDSIPTAHGRQPGRPDDVAPALGMSRDFEYSSASMKKIKLVKRSIQRDPTLRVTLLPKDTNAAGTIFGGVILSLIDLAGGIEARKHANKRLVTVVMKEVHFKRPVYVGDIVSLYTKTLRIGTTSVTVKVEVEVQRGANPSQHELVTVAEAVYVAVDETWKPIPVRE